MSAAFRDDLEAARSRAEALDEENEVLREEVARLRLSSARHPGEGELLPDRGPDPELARLAESTLEKLDHLNEDADASLPVVEEEAPPLRLPRHPSPERADIPAAIEGKPAPALLEPSKEIMAMRAEVELTQQRLGRAQRWLAKAFVAGVVLGAIIDHLLR